MREKLKSWSRRLLQLVPGRGTTSLKIGTSAPAAVTENNNIQPVVRSVVTLDPQVVVTPHMPALVQAVEGLGGTYAPGQISVLFEEVAQMFSDLFAGYKAFAEQTLGNAIQKVRQAQDVPTPNPNQLTTDFASKLKGFAQAGLAAIDTLQVKAKDAFLEARRLAIGINGNPNLAINAPETGPASWLPVTAAFAISLFFEVVFNAPILQDQGNQSMALAFSLLVSMAGSITTYFAGSAMKVELDLCNATQQLRETFPNGVDPLTGKSVSVFTLSGDAEFKHRMWFWLMAMTILGTLGIRWVMMTQTGDIAGSFGVVLVFAVLYAWEAVFSTTTHPQAESAMAKKVEAEALAKQLVELEATVTSPDAQGAYNVYHTEFQHQLALAKEAKETHNHGIATIRRLAHEFGQSPKWFVDEFGEAIEKMVARTSNSTESDDELVANFNANKPVFSIDLPAGLIADMEAVTTTPANENISVRVMTIAETEKTLAKITEELIAGKKAEAEKAALEVAKPAPPPPPAPAPVKAWRAPKF